MTTFAEQLAAHPKWRWLEWEVETHGPYAVEETSRLPENAELPDVVLNIEHPAVKGLLLASIRKDLGDTVAAYRWPHQTWTVGDTETGTVYASGQTEGEALAAARLKLWDANGGPLR